MKNEFKKIFLLKDCKIGRQSNLFKQKLKSIIEPKSVSCSSSVETISSSSLNLASNSGTFLASSFHSINQQDSFENTNLEDQLDDFTRDIIIEIYNLYKAYLDNIDSMCYSVQGNDICLELYKNHFEKCNYFISNLRSKS